MRALVTGGCGFIGRSIVKELVKKHYDVKVFDIELDDELIKELPEVEFEKKDILNDDLNLEGIDVVYHFAGLLGTSELFSRIIEAEKINVVGSLRLLESMRKHNVDKIIFASKPNVWKNNVYTITKENFEKYLHMYYEIYKIKPVILCPFNVYGLNEKIEQYRKAVPYFIISAIKGEDIEIFGDGSQTMDLIYVGDVAKFAVICGENPAAIEHKIELGSGVETSVKVLAETIIKLVGSKSKIKHLDMRKGEIAETHLKANLGKFKWINGRDDMKITSLSEGLTKTIEHYKNNLDKYQKIYEFKESEL